MNKIIQNNVTKTFRENIKLLTSIVITLCNVSPKNREAGVAA
jgi:hypothetical protein